MTNLLDDKTYAPVNGLKMHYEIKGSGDPLVFIPAAFNHGEVYPFDALTRNHTLITVDLQGHGRTADIPERPISLEQSAKDVVGLLKHLGISKVDFLGESYGGAIATMIALQHPELVRRVATYGATFAPAAVAHNPEMLRFDYPPTQDAGCFAYQKENYKKVAPDPDYWPTFWDKVTDIRWDGFSNEELASLEVPILIALGDHDFVLVDHALETFRRIPNAELAVIPDAGHFSLQSEPERVLPVVEHFLTKPETKIPLATAGTGYYPGTTR